MISSDEPLQHEVLQLFQSLGIDQPITVVLSSESGRYFDDILKQLNTRTVIAPNRSAQRTFKSLSQDKTNWILQDLVDPFLDEANGIEQLPEVDKSGSVMFFESWPRNCDPTILNSWLHRTQNTLKSRQWLSIHKVVSSKLPIRTHKNLLAGNYASRTEVCLHFFGRTEEDTQVECCPSQIGHWSGKFYYVAHQSETGDTEIFEIYFNQP